MKAFRLLRRNFEHGVHPAHHKQQTENLPIAFHFLHKLKIIFYSENKIGC